MTEYEMTVLERPDPPTGPTKLLIASNGNQEVLLGHVGRSAFEMTYEYGHDCEELCLQGIVDEGIWVVEGDWHTWRSYEGDWDMEFRSDVVREPTPDEWQAIMKGHCPWREEYAYVAPVAER